jgi:HEAT repeat protein
LSRQYSCFSLDRLIGKAAFHSDAAPRLLACDRIADTATPKEIREKYGNVLLTDKSQRVRRKAFWLIANVDPGIFRDLIERALMDPSASVQDAARSAWRLLSEQDLVSLHRKYVNEVRFPSAMVAALRGLRAEGDLHDEDIVRPFLQHNSAKVRKEALRTLVAWNVSKTSNLFHEGLSSASPSYAKEAARLLITRREYISVPLVKELLVSPPNPDSRKLALWLQEDA